MNRCLMWNEVFLICALSLPSTHHSKPAIVSWQAVRNEEDQLRDWIKKNNPDAEVFIHPDPKFEKNRQYGWEQVPFRWRGNEIWIRRKPRTDQKMMETSA